MLKPSRQASLVICLTSSIFYASQISAEQATPVSRPGYWKNSQWVTLAMPQDASHAVINSVTVMNGIVYAAGYCDENAKGCVPGYWEDGIWNELPSPNPSRFGEVTEIIAAGNHVYAAGYTSNAQNASVPSLWKNGEWVSLPIPEGVTGGAKAKSLTVSNGDVYVAACFPHYDEKGMSQEAGYWKNSHWVELKGPEDARIANANAIAVCDGTVYVGGSYSARSGANPLPCYWAGENCITLDTVGGTVNALSVTTGILYAAGYKLNSDNYKCAGYWNNSAWIDVDLPENHDVKELSSAVMTDTTFYTTAKINIGLKLVAGYWENNEWRGLPMPTGSVDAKSTSIAISGQDVYVAGKCWFLQKR